MEITGTLPDIIVMKDQIFEFFSDNKKRIIIISSTVVGAALLFTGAVFVIQAEPWAPQQPEAKQSEIKTTKNLTTDEVVKKIDKKLTLPDFEYTQHTDLAGEGWMLIAETFERDSLKEWAETLTSEGWILQTEGETEVLYQATFVKPGEISQSKIYFITSIDESGAESTWVDVRGPEVN